jgi:hypothetical protein
MYSHFLGRLDDAASNFAAVGYQQLIEHGLFLLKIVWNLQKTGRHPSSIPQSSAYLLVFGDTSAHQGSQIYLS